MSSPSLKAAAVTFVLVGLPIAASAQTPADIARQSWPLGLPTSVGVAPMQFPEAGGGSARDIARQIWPLGEPASDSISPSQPYTGGKLSGHYLARLRDGFAALLPAGNGAYNIARRN
jgi:hypothetical protein